MRLHQYVGKDLMNHLKELVLVARLDGNLKGEEDQIYYNCRRVGNKWKNLNKHHMQILIEIVI